MEEEMTKKRFVGIDLGKKTYEIKFIASNGKVTGTNGKTSPAGRKALYEKLLPTDRVAIEVCSLAMVMAKEIQKKVGCEVVLLNPSQIALIYRSVKKKHLGTAKNRNETIKILKGMALSQAERLLKKLELIDEQIEEVDKLLDKEIEGDKNIEKLIEIPGVGKQLGAAYGAFIGDGSRFPNVSRIGAATGLVPRLDMSSTICRLGHITKCGNKNLRSLLILAAWSHIKSKNGGAIKDKFIYMTTVQSKSKKIAIVAAARKLAELMYTLLKTGTSYEKRTSPEASKLAEEALSIA